jgi:hypothetical protein
MASSYLLDKTVRNISVAVVKDIGKRSGRIQVIQRSLPGEFPRADTTQLMKTLFTDLKEIGGSWEGYLGSPLDYSLFLELKMNRKFMTRTLNEERGAITRLLTGPIK